MTLAMQWANINGSPENVSFKIFYEIIFSASAKSDVITR